MIVSNEKLNKVLQNKNVTKSSLASKLGISSRTIAKISKGLPLSELVIGKICGFLGISREELIEDNNLLTILQREMRNKISGGIYHETQIILSYNSNHIEGSKLTEEQTRYIFETHTISNVESTIYIDDILETSNHFKCVDFVIEHAEEELSEEFIKHLQFLLKQGTQYSRTYANGEYKTLANTVGGIETTKPNRVGIEINKLLKRYLQKREVTIEDIIEFHHDFEVIHPFQDGNGRVGRLIAFKECLKNNIIPFYIDDKNKFFYYRGLKEWNNERGFLIDTCLLGQDMFKQIMKYFNLI